MSNLAEKATVSEAVEEQSTTKEKGKSSKKPGKGAKQRRSDNYRKNVGSKQLAEKRKEVEMRLGIFDDSCAELEKAFEALSITNTTVAIPLPAASRGVGFSSVVEYSRMCTTWNFDAIAAICTIHQYYRVALNLFYYKLYLARYDQGESVSYDVVAPFVLNEEVRQVLGPITQVPISTYNILCSVGKIEGSTVWHTVPFQDEAQDGEQAALYLYPTNIRPILESLSDPESDARTREQFHSLNPLPGARWNLDPEDGWVLLNPDDIWPANYDSAALAGDVHAYENLLTRVAGRLPPSFITGFEWSGKASKSGTVCMNPAPMSLSAEFKRQVPLARVARRRDACGRLVEAPIRRDEEAAYVSDTITGRSSICLVWSPDADTSSLEMIVGSASFVGEHVLQPTRLQIQGRKQANIGPGLMLYRLVDAPRPRPTKYIYVILY